MLRNLEQITLAQLRHGISLSHSHQTMRTSSRNGETEVKHLSAKQFKCTFVFTFFINGLNIEQSFCLLLACLFLGTFCADVSPMLRTVAWTCTWCSLGIVSVATNLDLSFLFRLSIKLSFSQTLEIITYEMSKRHQATINFHIV